MRCKDAHRHSDFVADAQRVSAIATCRKAYEACVILVALVSIFGPLPLEGAATSPALSPRRRFTALRSSVSPKATETVAPLFWNAVSSRPASWLLSGRLPSLTGRAASTASALRERPAIITWPSSCCYPSITGPPAITTPSHSHRLPRLACAFDSA